MSEPGRPLAGLRVIDFAQFLAGPVAALRLSDLGAEVIKVERPNGGDMCRSMVVNGQLFDGDSLVFHTFNRGKKSVAADLKKPVDLGKIKKLVEGADVMIHNFRPGVMERLDLDYDSVRDINPSIVYGSVSGYGADGPWRDRPGQDLLVQSLSGIAWLNGNDGDGPVPTGFAMVDVATAANLVQGILACLVRRGVTRQGGLVEVDLMSSALDMTFEQFTCFLNDDNQQPPRHEIGNANPYQPAPYGVYETADGHLALAMAPLDKTAELLDLPQLGEFAQGKAFSNRNEIKTIIAQRLSSQPTQHWLDILEPAGFWCAPILDWPTFVKHKGFAALEMLQSIRGKSGTSARTTLCPIRIDGTRLKNENPAPRLGEHTVEILKDA